MARGHSDPSTQGLAASRSAGGEGSPPSSAPGAFTLELLHIADQEASSAAVFDAPRLSAVMNALEAQDLGGGGIADNTLRLSSGDAILPGLFFQSSASVFGVAGVADMLIQNELELQAIAFGNHEFDLGSGFIADLIDGTFDLDADADDGAATPETSLAYDVAGAPAYAGTAFPYLSSNLDFSMEPDLAPLEVAGGGAPQPGVVASSVVLEENGELIGVVGATTPTLDSISSPGLLGVLPEEFDGDPTPEQLDALAGIIQCEVDALLAANPEMNKVVLLAHMQQITIEQELASRLTNVDIIVAGGSNTRLLDETDRLRDGDAAQGAYPLVVENAGGTDTLIVNTDGSYQYVGRLVIDFDADGNVLAESYDPTVSGAYATDDQGVADLDAETLIDPEIQAVADAIGADIAEKEGNYFGLTEVFLNGVRADVRQQQTNLGDLTADANLAEARRTDPNVVISIKNAGGIRDDIGDVVVPPGGSAPEFLPPEEVLDAEGTVIKPAGGISQNDIGNALSFNNDLTILSLTTAELAAVLEHGVAASTYDANGGISQEGRFPQIAGMEFSFDPDAAPGSRIRNAGVFAEDGTLIAEIVRDGVVVDNGATTFRVVTLGFLADGGDGYPFPIGPEAERVDLLQEGVRTGAAAFADDGTEQDALAEHLAANFLDTPFIAADADLAADERIQNLNFREDAVFEQAANPMVMINEIDSDTPGADTQEFVELYDGGAGGTSLDGLTLVFFNGGVSGDVSYRAIDLDGFSTDADGFFVAGNVDVASVDVVFPGNTLQNGADAVALYQGDAADFPNGATPATAGLVDAVVYDTNDADDTALIAALGVGEQFNEAGGAGGDVDALARVPDGSGDLIAQAPTPGASNVGDPVEPELTLISEIQGASAQTALDGGRVRVQAIVTQVSGALGGFWLQEEEADADDDPLTSEGVFVFAGSGLDALGLEAGDLVSLDGTVSEYGDESTSLTQLSGVSNLEIESRGVALPEAVTISLPLPGDADPAAFYETLENMRVSVVAGEGERLTVTDTYTAFGEVGVTLGAPLAQPTQAFPTGSGGSEALRAANARDILRFENAADDSLSAAPRVGDGIVGDRIDGVLHSSFGDYKVETPGAVEFDPGVNPDPRQDAPHDVGGRLKVASFNVLNYFTTLGERGAETPEELAIQSAKIVSAIRAIDADILGLIEIENDLSGVSDEATAALVDALNAEAGAGTYDYVATGRIGTDEIKQALIYKTEAVTPSGDFAVLDDEAFTAPYTPGEPQSRPALAQTFEEIGTGARLTVSVNHLKSKGSPTGAVVEGQSDDDPAEGSAALTRVAAAEELAEWLASDPTGSGDSDQLTIGDFNAYAMERAIMTLEREGLANLAGPEAVSYQFDGQGGTLDYAFANESLLPQVTGATVWNVNSPEAYSIQYNGTDFAEFGDLSAFASSDHDPLIVGLDLSAPRTIIAGTSGNDNLRGTSGDDILDGRGGRNDVLRGGDGADIFVFTDVAGRRDGLRIADYEAEDQMDLNGETLASAQARGNNLLLTLNGADGDTILLNGVSDLDELRFVDDPLV